MTPRTADRPQPQMSIEEFEELERRAPEMVRLEFLNGKVQVKAVPDGNHGQIVMWLLKQCMRWRPELSFFPGQGLKIHSYRRGRARPDGVLAPEEHFVGAGEWADSDGVAYRSMTTRPFGAVVELPDPVGITLETEKLKDYV
ncbi:Uma2 family endonuclease [Streptomyces sp. NPDC093109]|uniref:Uma2 family endonuclease n=1 Tax=Streptomyces sp. NPDC093109 TaxID=3154977 RepID=UPI00344FCF0C